MIINFFTFNLFIFISSVSIIGYGLLSNKLFFNNEVMNIGEIGIIGFFKIFFLSIFLHFFTELNLFINSIILILGIIFFLLFFKKFVYQINGFKSYFLFLGILFLLSSITLRTYADYEWYHLPYVNYLNNFKIIFGLVNLSNNYTYGHGWLDIIGLFYLPIIETRGLTHLPVVFYFFFIIFFLIEYLRSNKLAIKFFSLSVIFFILITFNRIKDFGADIQPTFTLLILLFYILKSFISHEVNYVHKILYYFFYSCVLRIGSVIFLPLVFFYLLISYQKILSKKFFINLKLYLFLSLFFIMFLTKNIFTTGCFFYPIPFTCIHDDEITWSSPKENVEERYEFLSSISKRWKFYSIEEGNLENKYDYYKPMIENKILTPKEYNLKKFFWFKYFFKDGDTSRIINTLLIILFPFIIILIFKEKNINISTSKNFKLSSYFIIIGIFFSSIAWIFMSPQMRYGGYAIIGGGIILLFSFYLNKFSLKEKILNIIFLIFLFVSLFYFSFKNLSYSIDDFINERFDIFPWPNYSKKIENYDYISRNKDGLRLNLVIRSTGTNQSGPRMCGNINMLCLPSDRLICIDEIKIINDYIFISNKNSQCLLQFQKNYWQH